MSWRSVRRLSGCHLFAAQKPQDFFQPNLSENVGKEGDFIKRERKKSRDLKLGPKKVKRL